MPGGVGAAGAGLFGDILSGEGETPPRSPPLVAIPPRSSARGDPVEELGPGLLSLPSRKPASAPLTGDGFPPGIALTALGPGRGRERNAQRGRGGAAGRETYSIPSRRPVGGGAEKRMSIPSRNAGGVGAARRGTFW